MTLPNFWEWSKDQPDIKPLQDQRDQLFSEDLEPIEAYDYSDPDLDTYIESLQHV